MLDQKTKKLVDQARDVLVGKVPDPKSQVEQITIALIYKFMNDMDEESINLGGKEKFFTKEYKNYKWNELLNPSLSGEDLINKYSEAIERISTNVDLPQLFRDIFKNAILPYRDPETLRMFLKVINEFYYDHSERLGDAYEYLLSILGSQGDAAQFRTPRHIIDFIVEAIDPQKHHLMLDPAAGTAGFLISAYKYIVKQNSNQKRGDLLNPREKIQLMDNCVGLDIGPDMVRLGLVNCYLHGFKNPNIFEYDTLTNEERWGERFDVIFSNPPFMTPKGGIRPHNLFSITSRRSEVLFVDYIIEHLNPKGRAGIIVPEGIMFVEQYAYKQLRRLLVEEEYLYAVVSLPHGLFKPYASVKTHILLLDSNIAKKTDEIMFIDIESDGYTQTDTRIKIDHDDLPYSLIELKKYRKCLESNRNFIKSKSTNSYIVKKSEILEQQWTHLIGRWYNLASKYPENSIYDYYIIDEVCDYKEGLSPNMKTLPGEFTLIVPAKDRKSSDHFDYDGNAVCIPMISSSGHGKADIKRLHFESGKFALADTMCCLMPKDEKFLDPKYLFYLLNYKKDEILVTIMCGSTNVTMKSDLLINIKIPIPDITIQREIVKRGNLEEIVQNAKELRILFDNHFKETETLGERKFINKFIDDLEKEMNNQTDISSIWPNNDNYKK